MSQSKETTNLNHNDRQPIHLPGSIQPHGVLLVLDTQLNILQVSANTGAYLHQQPQDLIGQSLSCLLNQQQLNIIQQYSTTEIGIVNNFKVSLVTVNGDRYFDVIVHRTHSHVILELEPTASLDELSFLEFHALVNQAIAKMHSTNNVADFLQLVAEQLREITAFDRVMVYQFDQHGAGCVVAEAKNADLSPYLGLHYPATDIPDSSRELYRRGMLRFIPNLGAASVELVPSQPVDLSFSILRSVDPCCVTFHQNMGVAALFVISLIQQGQLWGLISCHHSTPKYLTQEVRKMCEFLTQVVSLELAHKLSQSESEYAVKLKSLQSEFLESIAQADNFIDALIKPEIRLLDLVSATGAAVCLGDAITLVGKTPKEEAVRQLITWASTQITDNLYATDALPKWYPEALIFKELASGLLLLQISPVRRYYILWFRPEVIQTVTWAGNPQTSLQVEVDGSVTLCPRTSFAQWQETVQLTSLPWLACELDCALALRNAIAGIILKGADELARINLELARSNQELAAFAYAASHDLKEPLRGIYNFSTILLEDYAHLLDDEGVGYLETVLSLSQRMETLINAVLRLSQLGQAQPRLQPTDLNELVHEVIDICRASRPDLQMIIRIPRPLPTVQCHPILVSEVFSNLLSNALKYNEQAEPYIEIGYIINPEPQPGTTPIFYVQDNGIGIQEHHRETIFRLFKRLHSQEKYGGGTGAGLAIVKKIIELHNGRVWVESTVGVGSRFYFTIAP